MIAIKISGTEQRIFSILKISVFQIICAILGQRTNYNLKRIFTFDSTFKNAWWTKRGRRKGTRGGGKRGREEGKSEIQRFALCGQRIKFSNYGEP